MFFFFNYNRINAGLPNQVVGHHMDALFGAERAEKLRAALQNKTPIQRESMILEQITLAIKELGGNYVLPFRFKNSQGTRSSHHLVFVSKHVLGYKIMKEIMARRSSRVEDGVASFEYSPADENSPLLLSLLRPVDDLARDLSIKFSGQTLRFSQIVDRHHVNTPYVDKNYREALIRLEADGRINVITNSQISRRNGTFGESVLISFL
ncbi:three-Cys-motif partner protein TcmP [Oleisolibacter albus]|uniref:three-Cys-motif partner protein TcmP n=1 Tax=Oleisolibacter albus TaxID=2171757 RepID=UPI0019612F55|nr:three-Cys-motif partner protein TcmP [Oleisolibacter albus]